jgi:hypothetical protein
MKLKTKEKRKLAILKDALAQIKLGAYQAVRGSYIRPVLGDDLVDVHDRGAELQTLIKKRVTKTKPCRVCALGATFLSSVRVFDKLKLQPGAINGDGITGGFDREKLREHVAKFFSLEELALMEASFENKPEAIYYGRDSLRGTEFGYAMNKLMSKSATYGVVPSRYCRFLGSLESGPRLQWVLRAAIFSLQEYGDIRIAGFQRYALFELATNDELHFSVAALWE